MDIGAVLLILAVLLLVVVFISRPFLEARRPASAMQEHELSALMAERDRVITALHELDFDYSLGKIPAEDYPEQRTELVQRGANVLRKLDAIESKSASSDDAEKRIEAAIAARRADSAVHASAGSLGADDDIETLIATRRSERKEKSGGFCPNCGRPILSSDRFCPHCGKVIK
jgi:rubrerythrin